MRLRRPLLERSRQLLDRPRQRNPPGPARSPKHSLRVHRHPRKPMHNHPWPRLSGQRLLRRICRNCAWRSPGWRCSSRSCRPNSKSNASTTRRWKLRSRLSRKWNSLDHRMRRLAPRKLRGNNTHAVRHVPFSRRSLNPVGAADRGAAAGLDFSWDLRVRMINNKDSVTCLQPCRVG